MTATEKPTTKIEPCQVPQDSIWNPDTVDPDDCGECGGVGYHGHRLEELCLGCAGTGRKRSNPYPFPKRWFLDQDNDSHWYLVEFSKRAEWEEWMNLDSEDEESWDVPAFASRLPGSPSQLTFTDPRW